MSRGLRNNNPGNIRRTGGSVRYRGERRECHDPQFREFVAPEWGYRAMFVLLYTYQRRYGLSTPRELIGRWAPPSENHTENYIRAVCDEVGIEADRAIDLLDGGVMQRFVGAMSRVENGQKADPVAVARGWELFWSDFDEA